MDVDTFTVSTALNFISEKCFKEFLNDPTKNIYHSIDGIKIVKSEDGKLCGVGRKPRYLRT